MLTVLDVSSTDLSRQALVHGLRNTPFLACLDVSHCYVEWNLLCDLGRQLFGGVAAVLCSGICILVVSRSSGALSPVLDRGTM